MNINKLLSPFLLVLFFSCKVPYVASKHTEQLYAVKDTATSDTVSNIERMLKPYRDSLAGFVNEPIGEAQNDFHKEKNGGSLGNLITDAMMQKAKQQNRFCTAVIYNPGGIRIPDLMKGVVTRGKLLELLPFDNELVILEVKGAVLETWLHAILSTGEWPVKFVGYNKASSAQQHALFTYTQSIIPAGDASSANRMQEDSLSSYNAILYDSNKQLLTHHDTLYAERPDASTLLIDMCLSLNPDATYFIATNDYIANGGDNCDFLKNQKRVNTGLLIRDIVTQYIKEQKFIRPDNEKRMQHL